MRVYKTCKDGKEYAARMGPREGTVGESLPPTLRKVVPELPGGRHQYPGPVSPVTGTIECGPIRPEARWYRGTQLRPGSL